MPKQPALNAEVERLRARNAQLEQALLAQQNVQVQRSMRSHQSMARRAQALQDETEALQRAALLQRVCFLMAERSSAGLPLPDFLKEMHALLSELVGARNCSVSLFDLQDAQHHFAYCVDDLEGRCRQDQGVAAARGLRDLVLCSGRAQIVDARRLRALQRSGEVVGDGGEGEFSSWLGVPMPLRGQVAGVVALCDRSGLLSYTEQDAEIVLYFAHQLGHAIERAQALDAVRRSEQRYRTLIEKVGVGVVVVQEGRMVFVNPALERIVGHPRQYLMAQPFSATLHPDDVADMVRRHQRRLRGEPVEEQYGFRIITQAGEVRSLELSAVLIVWEERPATLMFVVDATARLQADSARRLALQHQAELTSIKARFIAMASHEFRTPLAAIHGSVELLQHYEDRMTAAQRQGTLHKIDEAVQRMTHMLENVLSIGRRDAGPLEFRPAHLAVGRLCKTLIDEQRSAMAAEFGRVRWELELPADTVTFLLDEALVRNMLGNLLSNAIKYSPQGGVVRLSVCDRGDALVLNVRDQGIGIPQADQAALFESFHRASNVGAIAGTGLGLAIVKQAVLCHGGEVQVHSAPGQGSRFTIVLPHLAPRTPPQESRP
ncbi:MAG: ATP-binding protein [Rhodoferax sp.]